MTTPRSSDSRLPAGQATPDPAAALADDLTPRYELGPVLGRGGFGAVHRARERASGREVALKLLQVDRAAAGATARFLREAAVAAALDHPGLVKVHGVGSFGGRPSIVYELVEGARPLDEVARTLDQRRRVELVRDAARAVGHAHARGALHRDLKPDNLLVDGDGRVRVTDFGLALVEGQERLTRTGALVGTPLFMAPEQFQGGRTVGAQADVWSLGVVLYQALTGQLPFGGESLLALAAEVDAARPRPPRSIDPAVDPAVEAVCLAALERDPARRPADGEALAAALDAIPLPRVTAPALGALVVAGVECLARRRPRRRSTTGTPAASASADRVRKAPPPPQAAPATRRLQERQLVPGLGPAQERWAMWVDDARFVTGGVDDALRLWDGVTGAELRAWPLRASAAARLPGGPLVVATRADGLHRLDPDLPDAVRGLDLAPVSQLVARGGRVVARAGARVLLLDASASRVVAPIPCQAPTRFDLSHDGALLALGTGTADGALSTGPVLLFTLDPAPRLVREVKVPGRARALGFTPDDRRLLVGTTSDQLLVIDVATGEVEHRLTASTLTDATLRRAAHRGTVHALSVSPDGRRAFSVSERRGEEGLELRSWDLLATVEVAAVAVLPGKPESLDLSPDGAALLVGTKGAGVHLRPVADARVQPRSLGEGRGPRWGLALDGRRALTGGAEDDVCLWEAARAEVVRRWPVRASHAVRAGEDIVLLLAAGALARLRVDDDTPAPLTRDLPRAEALAACADGARAALIVRGRRRALVVDLRRGEVEATVDAPDAALLRAAALTGDRLVLSTATTGWMDPGELSLYELGGAAPTLRARRTLVGKAVALLVAGEHVLAGTASDRISRVDLRAWTLVEGGFERGVDDGLRRSHGGTVVGLARAGGRLLSAGELDGGRRVELAEWDLASGEAQGEVVLLDGKLVSLDASPDGRLLVIATDREVHLRPLSP
ncbi:MAG: protein kinase [Planctomycetes bacterium]|nr:protein kinase [Planctomycetota bacterium]